MTRPATRRKTREREVITLTVQTPARQGKYLCLDVSSRTVGWALMGQQHLYGYGKFHPSPKGGHGEKLLDFTVWLADKLREADGLVVEVPYPGPKRHAYGVLSMYFGVVCMVHSMHFGTELPEESRIGPRAVKRALGLGKQESYEGRKRQMVEWVNAHYHLPLIYKAKDDGTHSDADIADAIGLGHTFFLGV